MCWSTGDGRRQYKSNGSARAWKLGDGKLGEGAARVQGREGVCVWRPRNPLALCEEEGRSCWLCLVIGLCTSIACKL